MHTTIAELAFNEVAISPEVLRVLAVLQDIRIMPVSATKIIFTP